MRPLCVPLFWTSSLGFKALFVLGGDVRGGDLLLYLICAFCALNLWKRWTHYFLSLIEFTFNIFSRINETSDWTANKCPFTPGSPLESVQISVFAQQLSKLNVIHPTAIQKKFYPSKQWESIKTAVNWMDFARHVVNRTYV